MLTCFILAGNIFLASPNSLVMLPDNLTEKIYWSTAENEFSQSGYPDGLENFSVAEITFALQSCKVIRKEVLQ